MSEEKKPVDMEEAKRRLDAVVAKDKLRSITSRLESDRRMARLKESEEASRVEFDRKMAQIKEKQDATDEALNRINRALDLQERDRANETRRVHVDKRTHRIRFDSESEESVTIVIEKREAP